MPNSTGTVMSIRCRPTGPLASRDIFFEPYAPLLFEVRRVILKHPGLATVTAVNDGAVVPHRPAVFLVNEIHRGQCGAHRHFGLTPGLATVVGEDHVATLAYRDNSPVDGLGIQ